MEWLVGACQMGFLQGLALGAASAAALGTPCPASSQRSPRQRAAGAGTEPALRVSQTRGDFMAWEHLRLQQSHTLPCADGTTSQASSWWEMQLNNPACYLSLSVSGPGPTAAGLPTLGTGKWTIPGTLYLHP